jgi:signal transduction histidine kinase
MFGTVARAPLVVPLIARAIIAVVFGGSCAAALIFAVAGPLGIGNVVAVFTMQVMAGTVLLVLPTVTAWSCYAAVIIAIVAVQGFLTRSVLDAGYSAVAAAVFGLELYGLTRLARLIGELHVARTELASAAVAHERLRFTRDMHDLLGESLAAIAPKGELAGRLIDDNPDRARRELAEIQGMARRAIADARAIADDYRDVAGTGHDRPAEASGRAANSAGEPTAGRHPVAHLAAVVFTGTATISALELIAHTRAAATLAAGVALLAAVLHLQLRYFSRPETRLRSRPSLVLLAVQACLVWTAVLFGLPWLALPGFLAGNALMVLTPLPGVLLSTATLAGVAVQSGLTGDPVDVAVNVIGVVVSGSVVYGLTWMTRSVTELHATRTQLADAALADERLRLARDLHDLLGLSLSAISLKSDLAQRLVAVGPAKARTEVAEILTISRLALADVRLVANGCRQLSLPDEFRSARSLLAAAEVDLTLTVNYGRLPTPIATLLATVLREGVTNVLRHSKGDHCAITVHQHSDAVSLDIVNNGVPPVPAAHPTGSGIHNLAYRAALLGGEVTAGLQPDGRFHLRALVPA